MNAPDPPPSSPNPALAWKVRALVVFTVLLLCSSALFLLYARGAFESTQRLVLIAEDSEGVFVGMDMSFSGFPIGRVSHIELDRSGKVRILVDVATKDAHWLRSSSVFTLVRGVVGSPSIRAYTGQHTDPALPDGAVRTVLQGDVSAELPKLISATKELLENLGALTHADGPLGASLANLNTLSSKLNGPGGALAVLLGSEKDAKKIITTIDRSNALVARLDSMVAHADAQIFGDQGVMPQTRATIVQLNTLLGESRESLRQVDTILKDAQAISGNARSATTDLGALRAEVEANLRKIESLVTEVNRKWPFVRDTEIRLP
ncbi:MAG: mammalian cell entry protein [Rhodoferax sp.]|nr:mammalian cell entry protein [Rhodoferax sp.]MCF8210960.1 mammalian cell entry protein [Rhodoferax sp.]